MIEPSWSDYPISCPICGNSLLGDPVPDDQKEFYAGNYFKREIGYEYPEKYDGVWEWKCPDCDGFWPSEVGKLK